MRMLAVMLTALVALGSAAAGPGGLEALGGLEKLKGLSGKVSPAEERAMGREAAATLLGASPPLADEALQRYVAQKEIRGRRQGGGNSAFQVRLSPFPRRHR